MRNGINSNAIGWQAPLRAPLAEQEIRLRARLASLRIGVPMDHDKRIATLAGRYDGDVDLVTARRALSDLDVPVDQILHYQDRDAAGITLRRPDEVANDAAGRGHGLITAAYVLGLVSGAAVALLVSSLLRFVA